MLNASGDGWHPYLVPSLRGKVFNILLLSMLFAIDLNKQTNYLILFFREVLDLKKNQAEHGENSLIYSLPLISPGSPVIDILPWCAIFVATDEPIFIYYYYLKSIIYIRIHSGSYNSMGFDKCVRSCIYHYSNIHTSFPALKIPCSIFLPLHFSQYLQPIIFLLSL